MTANEALALAQAHIIRRNQESPFHPDCEYAVDAAPEDFFDCWYFDYRIIKRKAIPWSELPTLGGAPGFIVSKADKSIQAISIHEYQRIKRREDVIRQVALIAEDVANINLKELGKCFTLPLPELVAFKRTLLEPSLTIDQRKSLLIARVMQEAELPL
jgi:hypothetical protein